MENYIYKGKHIQFHRLKIAKKQQLTKNTFSLEFDIPAELKANFDFEAGQYVAVRFVFNGELFVFDYSITSAPYEEKITLGIKVKNPESPVAYLYKHYQEGDYLEVSEPTGRFTLVSKPNEFRTIVAFAAGIGITPILSHIKHILYKEVRTRVFLFYGNAYVEDVVYKNDLDEIHKKYSNRFEVHYFYSKEPQVDKLYQGHIDENKLKLIINQILHLDDTDEESTIWDAVDEVLICGKGDMIKNIANACYENGIPKRNIHFELFEEYNEDIYPQEIDTPLIEEISVDFIMFGKANSTVLPNNKDKILQQLLQQKFSVPYSCKSGICGTCMCRLEEGEVELLENEYLTEGEEQAGLILACMSIAKSKRLKLNFDSI